MTEITKGDRKDAFERTYESIKASLEKGVIPWRKPWTPKNPVGSLFEHIMGGRGPTNWKSKKQYRGINIFLLDMQGFSSRFWLTFKQARSAGGRVRKGEKATPIVFWKFFEKEEVDADGNAKTKRIPFLRFYNVFNSEQCDWTDEMQAKLDEANGFNVEPTVLTKPTEFIPIPAGDELIGGYFDAEGAPAFHTDRNRAWYNVGTDTCAWPLGEQFDSADEFYSTAFHEIGHSTRHESRLDRNPGPRCSGDEKYSKEELVAEMTAAILGDLTGMNHKALDNAAAYIQHWLKALKDDPRMLVYAGSQAQKAVDFILDKVKAVHNGDGSCIED